MGERVLGFGKSSSRLLHSLLPVVTIYPVAFSSPFLPRRAFRFHAKFRTRDPKTHTGVNSRHARSFNPDPSPVQCTPRARAPHTITTTTAKITEVVTEVLVGTRGTCAHLVSRKSSRKGALRWRVTLYADVWGHFRWKRDVYGGERGVITAR